MRARASPFCLALAHAPPPCSSRLVPAAARSFVAREFELYFAASSPAVNCPGYKVEDLDTLCEEDGGGTTPTTAAECEAALATANGAAFDMDTESETDRPKCWLDMSDQGWWNPDGTTDQNNIAGDSFYAICCDTSRRLEEEQSGALPAPEATPTPSLWSQFLNIDDLDERPARVPRRWGRKPKDADRRI